MRLVIPALLILSCAGASAAAEPQAEPLLGAAAVLEAATKPTPQAAKARGASLRPSASEVAAYAALPDRSAAGWLSLAARWDDPAGDDAATAGALLAALPPATTWPAVRGGLKTIAAKPGQAEPGAAGGLLGLMATALAGRPAGQEPGLQPAWSLLRAALVADPQGWLAATAALPDRMKDSNGWRLDQVTALALDHLDDPAALTAALEAQLASDTDDDDHRSFPDLVAVLGEDAAMPLLRRILEAKHGGLDLQGGATRKLAVRLITEGTVTPASAPWSLVAVDNARTLYPLLAERFPSTPDGEPDWHRDQALALHVAALLLAGDSATALTLAAAQPDGGAGALAHLPVVELAREAPEGLTDLLRDLLVADPARPLWSAYATLAGQLGRADELRRMVVDHGAAAERQGQLIALLLAADAVEPAVAAMRQRMLAPPAKPDPRRPWEDSAPATTTALDLLELGLLLEQPAWQEEACRALAGQAGAAVSDWSELPERRTLLLIAAGRPALAERLLAAELAAPAERRWGPPARPRILAGLVRLYACLLYTSPSPRDH
jgi:hypothetical protein